ncbi:MAG: acyl-CoA dehydrogenase family protein [Promethearchaeota archaeon]
MSNFKTYTNEEIDGSAKLQSIRDLCVNVMCPELTWAFGASMLCIRSLMHNPNRSEVQEKAYQELVSGEKVGGIGITEPLKGSDAVNMQTIASIDEEKGTITYNGVKVFTTNGAVADYFTTYGVLDVSNPRGTMMLTLFTREDLGLSTERLRIPAAEPGVGIAKVIYDNVTVPIDRMVAPPGEGYRRLFRGLVPERLGIIMQALGLVWDSLAQGTIFAQMRHQFGKPLMKYQGISHVLSDIYAELAAYTAFSFHIAEFYDTKIMPCIHEGKYPKREDESSLAFNTAQAKYLSAKLSHHATYEIIQTMGGRGAINELGSNCSISRIENLTRIIEVTGGHRNIQLMLIEGGLRNSTLPYIHENIKKAKKEVDMNNKAVFENFLKRARKIKAESSEELSETTRTALVSAIQEYDIAFEKKNSIVIGAYERAIPKIVIGAEKELKKSKK